MWPGTHMSPSGGHDHTQNFGLVLVRDDFLFANCQHLEAEHSSVYYQAPDTLRESMSAGSSVVLRCSTRSFQGLTSGQLGPGCRDAKIVTPTLKWHQSRNAKKSKSLTLMRLLVEPSSILVTLHGPRKRVEDYRFGVGSLGHSQRV